jgi:hypothetical protein
MIVAENRLRMIHFAAQKRPPPNYPATRRRV